MLSSRNNQEHLLDMTMQPHYRELIYGLNDEDFDSLEYDLDIMIRALKVLRGHFEVSAHARRARRGKD